MLNEIKEAYNFLNYLNDNNQLVGLVVSGYITAAIFGVCALVETIKDRRNLKNLEKKL